MSNPEECKSFAVTRNISRMYEHILPLAIREIPRQLKSCERRIGTKEGHSNLEGVILPPETGNASWQVLSIQPSLTGSVSSVATSEIVGTPFIYGPRSNGVAQDLWMGRKGAMKLAHRASAELCPGQQPRKDLDLHDNCVGRCLVVVSNCRSHTDLIQ
jgi:hypothetical protein